MRACVCVCVEACFLEGRGDCDPVSLEIFPQDIGTVSGRLLEVTKIGRWNNLEERMDILQLTGSAQEGGRLDLERVGWCPKEFRVKR